MVDTQNIPTEHENQQKRSKEREIEPQVQKIATDSSKINSHEKQAGSQEPQASHEHAHRKHPHIKTEGGEPLQSSSSMHGAKTSDPHHKKGHAHKAKQSDPTPEKTEEVCGECTGFSWNKKTVAIVLACVGIIAILAVLALTLFNSTPADAAATVEMNGKKTTITVTQVQEEVNKLPSFYRQAIDEQTLQKAVLDELIAKALLLQKAEEAGVSVSDEEVTSAIDSIITQSGMTTEEFAQELETRGLTQDDVVKLVTEQLIITKFLEQEVFPSIQVSDAELSQYYEQHKDELVQVHASHILVCYEGTLHCTQTRTETQARTVIDEILQKLKSGQEFSALAIEYSDDPTADQTGGDLGWFTRGSMVPEFEAAAFTLPVGQVSGIVKTEYGYHVILVSEKKDSLDTVREELRAQLAGEEQQQAVLTYLTELKENATITYYDLPNASLDSLDTIQEAVTTPEETLPQGISTFSKAQGSDVCMQDGKPIIRMFSTTWCPHCKWVKETLDSVLKEYVDSGKIVAYHWEVDVGDNTLTPVVETEVPQSELMLFQQFSPTGGVPTYVFGCQYYRIGNGYEAQEDLSSEEAEFRAVIEDLIAQSAQ